MRIFNDPQSDLSVGVVLLVLAVIWIIIGIAIVVCKQVTG